MGFLDFLKKEDKVDRKFNRLNQDLENSFSNIKNDMENFGKWVVHLEKNRAGHHDRIKELENRIYLIEKMLEDVKSGQNFVQTASVSKHQQTSVRLKQTSVGVQTPVLAVQTPVQTAIQTTEVINDGELQSILKSLTVMERAVLWTLLNTDLKMSYDDLSILLGKDKSTLRGQINNIKRKSESLLSEFTEISGKKKFYIDENIKKTILKALKKN